MVNRVRFRSDIDDHQGLGSFLVFGGKDLDTLYATSTDKVYRRKLNAKGIVPWRNASKPPKPNKKA